MKTINTKQEYIVEQETYMLIVKYHYFFKSRTYYDPEEEDLEILSVDLVTKDKNGKDICVNITDFYMDFIDENLYEIILEEAREEQYA